MTTAQPQTDERVPKQSFLLAHRRTLEMIADGVDLREILDELGRTIDAPQKSDAAVGMTNPIFRKVKVCSAQLNVLSQYQSLADKQLLGLGILAYLILTHRANQRKPTQQREISVL